jgi:hypothetical protein
MTSSILSGEDIEVLKIVTEKKKEVVLPTTYGQQDGMLKQNSCFVWPEMAGKHLNKKK